MVCIAAFIILALIGIFVAVLSIFKKDIGVRYWKTFKKAWGCVWKKVRLQKCETNFKDDVKNSILRKVVISKPHLVKPLSVAIEVVSVLIVLVAIWALLTAIKSLLALWVFGTCNVSQPASCSLSSEICSIEETEPKNILESTGRWFTEWGEIFGAIPDQLHSWKVEDYFIEQNGIIGEFKEGAPYAMDIIDPGCSVCMQSYRNQQKSGFFEKYNTFILVYPIQLPDGSYKFQNSGIVARYYYAASIVKGAGQATKIIEKLFTQSSENAINFLSLFNNQFSNEEAEKNLQGWLIDDLKCTETEKEQIIKLVNSPEVDTILQSVKDTVDNKVHAKGIPTLIYDGKKHNGLYKVE
ncbi:hypothetical protein IJK16_03590 [Candidatus Saccharibacteria bacterium]|nr:hypothetical protein [Candidatus Saccharibacteria bacterium]